MSTDLEAYFNRIGYSGDRRPTLATLRELHRLQPAAIAFENLSPLPGHPVPIDAASLHRKMVAGGRGGYCYEQNLLLGSVLEALGFQFRHLTGWPRWQVAPGRLLPRTHLLLLVSIDGEDARDFDDAVYCEEVRGGWRLVVAIADVAGYVGRDSAVGST